MNNDPILAAQESVLRCNQLFDKTHQYFGYLYGRWCDEGQYENFNDYIDAARKKLAEHGAELVEMKQKPFAITFKFPSLPIAYRINVNRSQIKLTPLGKL
jgi:hypothetical protein